MNGLYKTSVANAESASLQQLENRKFPGKGLSRKTRPQRTVFYVDENPKALRLLTFVLEGCGYNVATARNSGEALGAVRATSDSTCPGHPSSKATVLTAPLGIN